MKKNSIYMLTALHLNAPGLSACARSITNCWQQLTVRAHRKYNYKYLHAKFYAYWCRHDKVTASDKVGRFSETQSVVCIYVNQAA